MFNTKQQHFAIDFSDETAIGAPSLKSKYLRNQIYFVFSTILLIFW